MDNGTKVFAIFANNGKAYEEDETRLICIETDAEQAEFSAKAWLLNLMKADDHIETIFIHKDKSRPTFMLKCADSDSEFHGVNTWVTEFTLGKLFGMLHKRADDGFLWDDDIPF